MEKFKRSRLELAYKAHVLEVYDDYLTTPDGKQLVYDYIKHRPGACVLPVTGEGKLVFVRQYRNTVDEITYEAPAGFIDEGESPTEAATRELCEETGYELKKLHFVTRTVLAIGTSDEQTYVFIGMCGGRGQQSLDENEDIEMEEYSIDEVDELMRQGLIVDSKTLIAIYAYKLMLNDKIRQM